MEITVTYVFSQIFTILMYIYIIKSLHRSCNVYCSINSKYDFFIWRKKKINKDIITKKDIIILIILYLISIIR